MGRFFRNVQKFINMKIKKLYCKICIYKRENVNNIVVDYDVSKRFPKIVEYLTEKYQNDCMLPKDGEIVRVGKESIIIKFRKSDNDSINLYV